METLRCDVLVVGAGPAGSCAAREAAKAGAEVLLVERRRQVGLPVQCAEYIPAPLVGEAGVGRGYVVQEVAGMRTWLQGGLIQELPAPGLMINRDRFDQALAEAASQAGARLLLGTAATALSGQRLTATDADGRQLAITARVVVGADGPHSRVGRAIGSVNRHCLPAVQFRVRLAKPLTHTEVFFDDRLHGGYAWLFPKGEQANLGLGMLRPGPGLPGIVAVLRALFAELRAKGRIAGEPLGSRAGWIPAEAPRRVVAGGVLLAGDAAGHTHPITGAGIFQAVMGGKLAGRWAARAALAGDTGLLGGYQEEWDDFYGETLARAHARRQLLESSPGRLDAVIRRCWVGFREYYAEA
ncbi:MAG: geranylgeranyl reductase family protein [Solidesulfovibrio sp. DCME]|uniref:geranylgeranyl reductase family protein n=1 Tax=Solidesulfovibrio sp. DCME TaxID=3447380 RepID=UPI003D1272FE